MIKGLVLGAFLVGAAGAWAQAQPITVTTNGGNVIVGSGTTANSVAGASITNAAFVTTPTGVTATLSFPGCTVQVPAGMTVQVNPGVSCETLQSQVTQLTAAQQGTPGGAGGAGAGFGTGTITVAGFTVTTLALNKTISDNTVISRR